MPSAYEIAPVFLIRMAGVPFETLRRVATPESVAASRQVMTAQSHFRLAKTAAEDLLARRENGLSADEFHALRSAVRATASPKLSSSQHSGFIAYRDAADALAAASANLEKTLVRELDDARDVLLQTAQKILPRYLMFGAAGANELLTETLPSEKASLGQRNKRARERERHLLLYLQRIAAKNDTFSEFGPSGWGRSSGAVSAVALQPEPGTARREVFLERWTAHALAAAINASVAGADLRVPAMEPHAFEVLVRDVEAWPASPDREKWLDLLYRLEGFRTGFLNQAETSERSSILRDARSGLEAVGAERKAGDRFLYAATNPIGEECFRECHFEVNQRLLDEVAAQAEPWIDLWRDTYCFIASRVAETLRHLMEKAGAKTGAMRLPDFLKVCEMAKLPLTGPGLIAPAVLAFQEVKAAFRQRLQAHADLAEYELTAEDCGFVRKQFSYANFDEYTYPSADLQLAASNTDAVASGCYRWILSELHPPIALLHHGGYWSCPDKTALNGALQQAARDRPNFHFGFFAADFTAHTTVRIFDALPELTTFVAAQRANPNWRRVPPDEAEVYIDPHTGDVALRTIPDHEHLGSFARAWIIPLGFHPFQFAIGPHTPRLRCRAVIVQRRTWSVRLEEFPPGKFHGTSPALLTAIEQLRANRNLPRHIYIRPTEQALRRSGAEGRDKDTKPIYVDLESYLFLEIFHRWLTKAGELEITEMLPEPDELLWQESDGHRTFELRTLVVPRKQ